MLRSIRLGQVQLACNISLRLLPRQRTIRRRLRNYATHCSQKLDTREPTQAQLIKNISRSFFSTEFLIFGQFLCCIVKQWVAFCANLVLLYMIRKAKRQVYILRTATVQLILYYTHLILSAAWSERASPSVKIICYYQPRSYIPNSLYLYYHQLSKVKCQHSQTCQESNMIIQIQYRVQKDNSILIVYEMPLSQVVISTKCIPLRTILQFTPNLYLTCFLNTSCDVSKQSCRTLFSSPHANRFLMYYYKYRYSIHITSKFRNQKARGNNFLT